MSSHAGSTVTVSSDSVFAVTMRGACHWSWSLPRTNTTQFLSVSSANAAADRSTSVVEVADWAVPWSMMPSGAKLPAVVAKLASVMAPEFHAVPAAVSTFASTRVYTCTVTGTAPVPVNVNAIRS